MIVPQSCLGALLPGQAMGALMAHQKTATPPNGGLVRKPRNAQILTDGFFRGNPPSCPGVPGMSGSNGERL
jgi:hypothetical protein